MASQTEEVEVIDSKEHKSRHMRSLKKVLESFHKDAVTAIIESVILLSVITLLSYLVGSENRWMNVKPHPFWIVVLVVTVQYGTIPGIMATFLSCVYLYLFNVPSPISLKELDHYEYILFLTWRPCLWLLTNVILGEIRMRHRRQADDLREELERSAKRDLVITRSYNKLKESKEELETHIAGQFQSSIATYQAIKAMESFDPLDILMGVGDALESVLHPSKYSVYALGETNFEPVSSVGWTEKDNFLRQIPNSHPLYQELVSKRRLVSVVNDMDARILDGQGLLAAPLIDQQSGEIFGMIKVEDLDFKQMTLSNVESFRILCECAGMSYAQAKHYNKMKSVTFKDLSTELYTQPYYEIQLKLAKALAKRSGMQVQICKIKIENRQNFKRKELEMIALYTGKSVKDLRSDTLQLFQGRQNESDFVLLMQTKEPGEAIEYVNALKSSIANTKHELFQRVHFGYDIQKLA